MSQWKTDLKQDERRVIMGTAVLSMVLLLAAGARAAEPISIPEPISLSVTPASPQIGDSVLVKASAGADVHTVGVSFLGHKFHLHREGPGQKFTGLAPVGLSVKPGAKRLRVVSWAEDGSRRSMEVILRVRSRSFERDELEVSQSFTTPDRTARGQIARDSRRLSAAWRSGTDAPLFDERFLRPLPTEITGAYGTRRVFNGKQQSRHRGVDLDGEVGDLVPAANRGRVVLATDLYYSGGTVILDHGAQLFTMYFHLSRIDVKPGDLVEPGETLGAVGASGRVTGPHLHFGAKLRGTYVDPLALQKLPLGDGPIDVLALR